jgi:3-oxoacyl-[acyl-carrier-protein] synthase III
MNKIRAAITAVGGYVPDYILTNKELETMVETSDEWIISRTGIRERRILKASDKGTSYMGAQAVKELLRKSNTDPASIDLIICATVTPDMMFPSTANLIADQVGATNSFSFDIGAACSGFIYALTTGAKFIEAGTHKKVIVIGADKMSAIVDYTDRATCIIFGDGGGAVLLEPVAASEDVGIIDSILRSDGSGAQFLHMKAGGSLLPATHATVDARQHFIFQEGATVFKFAIKSMADICVEIMKRHNLKGDDISWLLPHQANKRILSATADRMGLQEDKVMINIDRYGNTTAGTIPLLIWDYEKKFKKGDKLILTAFGGGFTWGAVYLKWAYN